jgi:hypothetical protein
LLPQSMYEYNLSAIYDSGNLNGSTENKGTMAYFDDLMIGMFTWTEFFGTAFCTEYMNSKELSKPATMPAWEELAGPFRILLSKESWEAGKIGHNLPFYSTDENRRWIEFYTAIDETMTCYTLKLIPKPDGW